MPVQLHDQGAPVGVAQLLGDHPRLKPERESVLCRAEDELARLRHSSRAPSTSESAAGLRARIVEHGGSGLTRREVAVLALTSETVVERQAKVRELAERMNAREISRALSVSYSFVLRTLGRKA